MTKRNLIKTTVAVVSSAFLPSNLFAASKEEEWEDIAAKIMKWLPEKTGRPYKLNSDICKLINAIHNNDKVVSIRNIDKTFCIMLLASYQANVENKTVVICTTKLSSFENYYHDFSNWRIGMLELKELDTSYFDSTEMFLCNNVGKYKIDVVYCDGVKLVNSRNIPNKYFKIVEERDDTLFITTVKDSVMKNYKPSVAFQDLVEPIYNYNGYFFHDNDFPRWC